MQLEPAREEGRPASMVEGEPEAVAEAEVEAEAVGAGLVRLPPPLRSVSQLEPAREEGRGRPSSVPDPPAQRVGAMGGLARWAGWA